jgi:uncharacterized protein YbbC (DUF1343 family)
VKRALIALALAACSAPALPTTSAPPRPSASASVAPLASSAAPAPTAEPLPPIVEAVFELPAAHQKRIDDIVAKGIADGDYPGAVVLVMRRGRTVFERAYGSRSVKPSVEAMTIDTVFDMASLTKPIVTATSVMQLVDQGKIALADPISKHLPGCGLARTVEQLLAHTTGLPAANALSDYRGGRDAAVAKICKLKTGKQGKMLYSDLGYILLAEMVAAVSGEPYAEHCDKALFTPLAMRDAGFVPDAKLRPRIAPTAEREGGGWLRGEVHDPRAAALAGVAGHAGLFATAADLARFAAMMLGHGEVEGTRILSPESVALLTAPRGDGTRSLGYTLSAGGYGHTGFTGTYLWIDPRGTAVIVLASRLHPGRSGGGGEEGDVSTLRREVRRVVIDADKTQPDVATGIDALLAKDLAALAGRKVGLLTNRTGRTRAGERTADVIHRSGKATLVALFTPEHGLEAAGDGVIGDGRDAATGAPIHSLYGKAQRPTKAQLAGIDTLVVDLQSLDARFYTYATTLGYALEAAAVAGIEVVVLDRPNPTGGAAEGPLLDKGRESFIAYHALPVRHGMTLGELARLFNDERGIGAKLTVVAAPGWRRSLRQDETGLTWVDPSPNIRSLAAALVYPGLGLLEATNVSVGRGTDAPFTRFGAPWLDAVALLAELEQAGLAGVRFTAEDFTPASSTHAHALCHGLRIDVTDADALEPVRLGVAIAVALRKLHKSAWHPKGLLTMLGNQRAYDAILASASLDDVVAGWQAELGAFQALRKKYLLYPD